MYAAGLHLTPPTGSIPRTSPSTNQATNLEIASMLSSRFGSGQAGAAPIYDPRSQQCAGSLLQPGHISVPFPVPPQPSAQQPLQAEQQRQQQPQLHQQLFLPSLSLSPPQSL